MGTVKKVYPAALIAGIIFSDDCALDKTLESFSADFGPIELKSPAFDFVMTDYYTPEMGEKLKKQFICFRDPINLTSLPDAKILANCIECDLGTMQDGKLVRTVNIDPGYVTLAKLILASTKDFSHRIYIGKGIYAETTLCFINNSFKIIDTTYPDYQTPLAIEFFNSARDYVKRNMQQWTESNELMG